MRSSAWTDANSDGRFGPTSLLENLSIDGAHGGARERALVGRGQPRENGALANRIKQLQAVALFEAANRDTQPRSPIEQAQDVQVQLVNVMA